MDGSGLQPITNAIPVTPATPRRRESRRYPQPPKRRKPAPDDAPETKPTDEDDPGLGHVNCVA